MYIYALAFRKDTGAFDIKLSCKCEMSNAAVRQLDFDRSSKFLQVLCCVALQCSMFAARCAWPACGQHVSWAHLFCLLNRWLLCGDCCCCALAGPYPTDV